MSATIPDRDAVVVGVPGLILPIVVARADLVAAMYRNGWMPGYSLTRVIRPRPASTQHRPPENLGTSSRPIFRPDGAMYAAGLFLLPLRREPSSDMGFFRFADHEFTVDHVTARAFARRHAPHADHYERRAATCDKARGLVARGWAQKVFAADARGVAVRPTDPAAVAWCLTGAIAAADPAIGVPEWRRMLRDLGRHADGNYPTIGGWNDAPERTQAHVESLLYGEAIAARLMAQRLRLA